MKWLSRLCRREEAMPATLFPDTKMGRQLYRKYRERLCVQLRLTHRVHYLQVGDVVSLGFQAGYHRPSSAFDPMEEAGFLLIEGSAVFLYLLSDVSLNYRWGWRCTMQPSSVREVRLNGKLLELPVTVAPAGAPMT